MGRTTVIVVCGALAALMVSLGVAWAMSAHHASSAQEALSEQREALTLMQARVDALERRVRQLDGERDALASAPAPAARPGEGAPQAPPRQDAAQAALGPRLSAEVLLDPEAQPEVREAVQGMVRDGLAIEREERRARRAEQMKKRMRSDVAAFAQRAGIEPQRAELVADQLSDEHDRVAALWSQAFEEGVAPDKLREQTEAQRAQTDREVEALLDEEQFARYQEYRAEEVARFTGQRGARRGGGGQRSAEGGRGRRGARAQ